jgi:hypothetical protein
VTLAESRPRHGSLGLALSVVGAVIAAFATVAEVGGGLLLGAIGSDIHDERPPSHLAGLLTSLVNPTAVLIAVLFAACFLIPGEQLRRGNFGRSQVPQTSMLPKASTLSRFRLLGTGWHALWVILGLGVALVLVLVPAVATLTQSWPTTLHDEYNFAEDWQIVGVFALAIAAAAAASLYKKVHYRRLVARRGDAVSVGTAKAAFWQAATYRWRCDIWLVGLGGLLAGFAGTAVSLVDWGSDPDEGTAAVFIVCVLVAAVAIAIVGLWMSANFWRAGKPLGSAESYS